jgi:hypothetical protein
MDREQLILNAIFLEWMEKLRRYIAANGEYFEEAQKGMVGEIIFNRQKGRCYTCLGEYVCTEARDMEISVPICRRLSNYPSIDDFPEIWQ